jgi:hypothetical protein
MQYRIIPQSYVIGVSETSKVGQDDVRGNKMCKMFINDNNDKYKF